MPSAPPAEIRCPCLLLHGSADTLVPVRASQQLLKGINSGAGGSGSAVPKAALVVAEGAGHDLLRESAEARAAAEQWVRGQLQQGGRTPPTASRPRL